MSVMEVRCPRCNRTNYCDKNHFCTGCDEPLFMHRELLGEFAREHFSANVEPSRSSLPKEGAWHFVSLCPVLDEGGYQWLPLHWAVFFNQREIAELLLASGIEVNAPSGTGDIPLHMARSPGMARLLISKGASVNARNQRGETPLFVALRFGKNDLITLLIHHGASVNARDNHGSTPLHRTAREGAREMAELLLLFGADVGQ